ncbi:MAG: DUF6273 domain-containing protein [Candidatus Dehalobacter alkaniphilus]
MPQSINNLAVGAKIKFGSIYGSPIVWLVADKNHAGYPSSSITFVAEKIIKLLCFDAIEVSNSDSNRRSYGNNRYLQANLRQWLNSAAAAGAWYTAQHSADAPPSNANVWSNYNEYDALAGFLNAFSVNERNALLSTTLTVARNTVTDGGGSETVADKVFLLSNTEVGLANENGVAEGSILSLFNTSSNRITQPTAAAVSNSEYTNGSLTSSQPWYWWLRTPYASSSYVVRGVDTDGSLGYSGAYNGDIGLRPAFNLSSGLLISDSADGDGCYTIVYNQAPTVPASISVPSEVIGGQSLTVTWGQSTDADGNLSGYRLERQYNGGSWAQIYEGSPRTYTDAITFGWTSVRYRVKAYDAAGAESGYTTSDTRTVTNNRDPVISGSNGSLGSFTASPPSYNYTVTDADGDTVTVVEKLDGATLRTYTPTLGATNTLTFTAPQWRSILNGNHTLTITATDPMGATATRTMTFTKAVTQVAFTTDILAADDMPTKAIINIQGSFPAGSDLSIEICNNAHDASPAWEDITTKVLNAQKHFFTNTTKTAADWGVALKVTLNKGTATETCYIHSIGGNFG